MKYVIFINKSPDRKNYGEFLRQFIKSLQFLINVLVDKFLVVL